MLFTAYIDEADTHGPSPTIIMSAFMGRPYQWRRFDRKLAVLRASYDFTHFHAKDFKARRREFEGWSDYKCNRLINDFIPLLEGLTQGMSVSLDRARYESEYRAPPIPAKMSLDSQYGVCFRAIVGYCVLCVSRFSYTRDDKIDIILEEGHANSGDCRRIFHQLKDSFEANGNAMLGQFTLATKGDCARLMIADLLAATHSLIKKQHGDGSERHLEKYYRGSFTLLEFAEGSLEQLKADFGKLRRSGYLATMRRRAAIRQAR